MAVGRPVTTVSSERIAVSLDAKSAISLMISCVSPAVLVALWIQGSLYDLAAAQSKAQSEQEKQNIHIASQLTEIRGRMELLGANFELSTGDRWRFHDMVSWSRLLQARNPSMNVPEPERDKK